MSHKPQNTLLVANWDSDVGYAWWLMENFWLEFNAITQNYGGKSCLAYPSISKLPEKIQESSITPLILDFTDHSLSNILKICNFIKNNRITSVYLTDQPYYSLRYLMYRLYGARNIIIHDHAPGERAVPTGIKKLLKKFLTRLPYITGTHFIGVTKYIHQRHIEVAQLPEKKCFYADNGIVPISRNDTPASYAHQQFNIPEDKKIIISTGRANIYKGIDFIIEVCQRLISTHKRDDFHFLHCGDGPDLELFQSLIDKYQLNSYFTLAGKRSDVRKLLPDCFIGLHASKGEVGYSLSILEYMSAGLVTIVPDNPSTSMATDNGVDGLTFQAGNIDDAVEKILLTDKLDIKKLTQAAIKKVQTIYNIDNTNTTFRSIINRILEKS